jgi:hypothetical protein
MKIAELFRKDPTRQIAEVIKVTADDADLVRSEIDEYIVTDHIRDEFDKVLEAYRDSIDTPTENTNIWISGFFGSGKSSFAKMLGHILGDRHIDGVSTADLVQARTGSDRARALLGTIHTRARTITVQLDLSSGVNVLGQGESVVLPLYRHLLKTLDYATDELLAELEFTLEADGQLEEFEAVYPTANNGKTWRQDRDSALSQNRAAKALHHLDPESYPHVDSWFIKDPIITAEKFAVRALELLAKRGNGATRIAFIVDEAGQYVARDRQRMLDLQGVAESMQKRRGPLWLIATSQERLEDIVDALESRQTELARVRDRFPIEVDLKPSDIHEVAGKRLLDKTDAGQKAVRAAYEPNRNKVAAAVGLAAPGRDSSLLEDDVIRLYPLLPYHVQLLIDAISARRLGPTAGGSNRTIIKLTQQLLTDPRYGMGNLDVGALVTIDRAARLVTGVVPPGMQAEVDQVAEAHGDDSLATALMRVATLCFDTPRLPLSAENLAALTHPGMSADSRLIEVRQALDLLVAEDRLSRTDKVYSLQNPEQKGWEKERRSKDLTPSEAARLRKTLVKEALTGLTVNFKRSFRVALEMDEDRLADGEVTLQILDPERTDVEAARARSRADDHKYEVHWVAAKTPTDTWDALRELNRSDEMISKKNVPSRNETDNALLARERSRRVEAEQRARSLIERDLAAGTLVFEGTTSEPGSGTLRQMAERCVLVALPKIYPDLGHFAATVGSRDALQVLRASGGGRSPAGLGDDGIGLFTTTATGDELVTDRAPLIDLLNEVKRRVSYGESASGDWLARELAKAPRGADIEVVRVLCAAALRYGHVEVTSQGVRINDPSDQRLDKVFGTIPGFRNASFSPPPPDVELSVRSDVSEKLGAATGMKQPLASEALARSLREWVAEAKTQAQQISAGYAGAGCPIPEVVNRILNTTGDIATGSDAVTLTTAHQGWDDLAAGRITVAKLADSLDQDLGLLRQAATESTLTIPSGQEGTIQSLKDLLAAGDLPTHRSEIAAAVSSLSQARTKQRDLEYSQLTDHLLNRKASLRTRYAGLDPEQVSEALRDLDTVIPPAPEHLQIGLADLLRMRLDQTAARADELLGQALTAGQLVTISVSNFSRELIATPEQLKSVLEALRTAVQQQLDEGKQVRLT